MADVSNMLLQLRSVWAIRIFGILTTLLLLLAFLFCMINGSKNSYNYLLGINILMSGLAGGMVTRWFSSGELAESKLWYVMLFGGMLIVQSVVYDVFAFHEIHHPNSNSTAH